MEFIYGLKKKHRRAGEHLIREMFPVESEQPSIPVARYMTGDLIPTTRSFPALFRKYSIFSMGYAEVLDVALNKHMM
jgi:hypothetical protein